MEPGAGSACRHDRPIAEASRSCMSWGCAEIKWGAFLRVFAWDERAAPTFFRCTALRIGS